MVVLVLLEDGEDAGRRLASRDAGRHRRAQDPAVGIVESDLLALDRHDRHDRLACIARRRRLDGRRGARLSRRGVGGQRRQCGHRRQRHHGGRSPTPHRHGGLRRRKSICHAMPRLKCVSALVSIEYQIAMFGLTNRRHHPNVNSLMRTASEPAPNGRMPLEQDQFPRGQSILSAHAGSYGIAHMHIGRGRVGLRCRQVGRGYRQQAGFVDEIQRALVLDGVAAFAFHLMKTARITPVPPLAFFTVCPIL